MRGCVQRVTRASVTVDRRIGGQIAAGLLVLLGVDAEDTPEDMRLGQDCSAGAGFRFCGLAAAQQRLIDNHNMSSGEYIIPPKGVRSEAMRAAFEGVGYTVYALKDTWACKSEQS